MKKFSFYILLIVVIILALAGCSKEKTEKIALLDIDALLQNSERAQQLQTELLNIGQRLEAEYLKKEAELSPEEGQEELDLISQEYLDHKQRLENNLNEELNQAIREVVEEEGISIVLYRESVYYGGEDITDKVSEKLDENFKEKGESNNG
ncbi:MAG TPA: OmpH family outer membrane protein [Halanaerobiaceae bacterium]|jgi:outer membrane protein|nr:OmpH family outer membrane protein [Bacillota bacterium]HHU92063.1 OmpH family outer membrane protein [Halanaerobiaceae bacterium]HOA40187.1 OmpH family outer membrane protein [Halanaerobiales bacterium]HPZ62469.1 OmpH family outer membrane protein [Halanaerobiales bacterium]HQD03649.1 OmpH family outer membrane protein [Halanaerobiales bacterium]